MLTPYQIYFKHNNALAELVQRIRVHVRRICAPDGRVVGSDDGEQLFALDFKGFDGSHVHCFLNIPFF